MWSLSLYLPLAPYPNVILLFRNCTTYGQETQSQTSPGSHGQILCLSHRHDLFVYVNFSLASLFPSRSEEKLLKMPSHSFNIILPLRPCTGFNRFVPCFLPFCHYHNSSTKTFSCQRRKDFVSSCILTTKFLAVFPVKKACKMVQQNKLLLTHQTVNNYLLSRKISFKFFSCCVITWTTHQLFHLPPQLQTFALLLLFSPCLMSFSFILYFIQQQFTGFKPLKSPFNCSGLRDVLLVILENDIQTKQSDLEMKTYIT